MSGKELLLLSRSKSDRLGGLGGLVVLVAAETTRSKNTKRIKLSNYRMEASLARDQGNQISASNVYVPIRLLPSCRWAQYYEYADV